MTPGERGSAARRSPQLEGTRAPTPVANSSTVRNRSRAGRHGRWHAISGEARRVFIHVRWPVQSYVLLGFLFGSLVAKNPIGTEVVLGFVSWFLICAGLTVFNSYYDKDEDPVGGMAKPPKVTSSLLYASLLMQIAGLIIAIVLGGVFLWLAIAVVILYVLYSHRLFRFKSNGYAAVTINAILGSLTVLAAASVGHPSDAHASALALAFAATSAALFKASVYMMMQVHQIREDTIRGDISIAVIFGRTRTLRAALLFIVAAGIATAAALSIGLHAYLLSVLVLGYFFLMAVRLRAWLPQPEDPKRDYAMVRQMVALSGYLGSVVCLGGYIYFNIVGFG